MRDTELYGHNAQVVSMFSRCRTFLRGEMGSCLSLKGFDFQQSRRNLSRSKQRLEDLQCCKTPKYAKQMYFVY